MDKLPKTSIVKSTKYSESVPYHQATISNHQHQIKSREYSPAQVAQMSRRLNAIALSMGFQKLNSPEVLLALAGWIKEQFGDFSMQEVSLAFDMVTAKKIGQGIKHFDTFSKQYIGEVLDAFRTWRGQQIKLKEEHEAMMLLTKEVISVGATGEEMYNALKKIAVKKGEIMIVADWNLAFKYAQKKGHIEHLSNDEKDIYKENVRADLQQESASESNRSSIMKTLRNDRSLADECRKRMLTDHLKKLIEETEEQRSKDDKKPEK